MAYREKHARHAKGLARTLCCGETESDSMKLSSLVQELIEALDEGERSWRHPIIRPSDTIPTNREAD
jgi:hypothetical protein